MIFLSCNQAGLAHVNAGVLSQYPDLFHLILLGTARQCSVL